MIRTDAITLKQLRALAEVVRHGTLTAAAQVMGLTTPAIHSQIKNLETAVGFPVLVRDGDAGRMAPTAEGMEILLAAQRIDAILSQTAQQIRARETGHVGHVTISVVSTGKYFAPRLVRRLRDLCPDIEVQMQIGNRSAVMDELAQGRCDLAIMGRPPREPEVSSKPLGPHPHGIILPPNHPLAGADNFDPDQLAQETFLSREPGSGTRILMQRFLDQLRDGAHLRIVEMDSNETIKQSVMAGLGVAFLSLHTVFDELQSGRLVQLRGPRLPVMRHWYLVTPRHVPAGPAAQRIAAEIEAMNGAFLPQLPMTD